MSPRLIQNKTEQAETPDAKPITRIACQSPPRSFWA
jgi:hypothetical protein